MKRNSALRYLFGMGCRILREGAKHTLLFNPLTGQQAPLPRHREVDNWLVELICQQLGIPGIKRKH